MDEVNEDELMPMPGKQLSPLPPRLLDSQILMSFPTAMQEVIAGKSVARMEWPNKEEYCLLKDGFLTIYINGEFKRWLVSDGDLLAEDWIVVPQGN